MKNLTDNEIINALECCSKDEINGLNIFTYGGVPMRSLLLYALDLINRQKAEIEALINGQETLQKYIAEQKAEIERLQKHNTEMARKHYQDGKSEAVKELQKIIHKKLHDAEMHGVYDLVVTKDMFDDAVKEMGV